MENLHKYTHIVRNFNLLIMKFSNSFGYQFFVTKKRYNRGCFLTEYDTITHRLLKVVVAHFKRFRNLKVQKSRPGKSWNSAPIRFRNPIKKKAKGLYPGYSEISSSSQMVEVSQVVTCICVLLAYNAFQYKETLNQTRKPH